MGASVVKQGDGYALVRVSIPYGTNDMTPLEAEHLVKEIKKAIEDARRANFKPARIGDHR